MSKGMKPISAINEAFAALVRRKGTQVEAAALLGISSQSVGYYMRGRKIPADVILKVQQVYGVNLLTGKTDGVRETIVSRETKRETKNETKTMDMDVWEVIKLNSEILGLEFKNLWDMIHSMRPESGGKIHNKTTNGES